MSKAGPITSSSTTATIIAQSNNTTVSFTQLIPGISAVITALSTVIAFSLSLFRPLLVFWPLPIILYLFAPITTFIDVATTLFIRIPYWSLAYFFEAIYPLYVLLGVACITGALLGMGGRVVCYILTNSLTLQVDEGSQETERTKVGPKDKARRPERVKFEQP